MGGLQEFAFKETQNYHVRFPFKNPISVTEPLRVDCVLDAPKTLSFFLFHHYFLCRSQLSKNSLFQSQWIKLLFIRQDFIMSFYRYRDSRKLHNIWLKTKWRFLDQSLTWLLVLKLWFVYCTVKRWLNKCGVCFYCYAECFANHIGYEEPQLCDDHIRAKKKQVIVWVFDLQWLSTYVDLIIFLSVFHGYSHRNAQSKSQNFEHNLSFNVFFCSYYFLYCRYTLKTSNI